MARRYKMKGLKKFMNSKEKFNIATGVMNGIIYSSTFYISSITFHDPLLASIAHCLLSRGLLKIYIIAVKIDNKATYTLFHNRCYI